LVEREAGTDDIGNRIPGTDFMEVDGLWGFSVDGGFRFRQRLKDLKGKVARAFRQRDVGQQAGDLGQPAMRVVMGVGVSVGVGVIVVMMMVAVPVVMVVVMSVSMIVMFVGMHVIVPVSVAVRIGPERLIVMRVVRGMDRDAQTV
jgi:hypothetical protein